jgi:glycosyltransferase involved in cell wall biosynthesis
LPNFAGASAHEPETEATGRLRIVFLSRISTKKNLLGAIRILRGVEGAIDFSIYGPIEDRRYWEACVGEMKKLPANICPVYRGELPHTKVSEVFAEHDVFLFPTLGENFGHVILEALLAGCPVVTSNQVPWLDLQANGAGWALPLEPADAFTDVLQRLVYMDAYEFGLFTERAQYYGRGRADRRPRIRIRLPSCTCGGRRADSARENHAGGSYRRIWIHRIESSLNRETR